MSSIHSFNHQYVLLCDLQAVLSQNCVLLMSDEGVEGVIILMMAGTCPWQASSLYLLRGPVTDAYARVVDCLPKQSRWLVDAWTNDQPEPMTASSRIRQCSR